jgi:electron transport complex protein RnfD
MAAAQDTTHTAADLRLVSTSPHVHSGASVRRIMLDVILALAPAFAFALLRFGWDAARLTGACVLACVATEAACRRLMGRNLAIGDLSAAVTGVLLAFNLPPALPTWMAVLGSIVAIAIAKQVFGGIGYNPFNPALVGRAMLLVSFPVHMTAWSAWRVPAPLAPELLADAVTTATPLGLLKTSLSAGAGLPYRFDAATAWQFFLGQKNGCIGEVCGAALLLGAAYLLARRVISWHIPAAFLGTVAALSGIVWAVQPETALSPLFHLLTGGVLLGALFMATDMVTSPLTRSGQLVFGCGCGLLTVLIRVWGGYPEGVSFAILLMNALTPLINRATRPRVFGVARSPRGTVQT